MVIPVFEDTGVRLALLPGGRLLSAPAGGAASAGASSRFIDLPALPRGFRYTDIVKSGSFLVASWEESRFTDVGRAGILLLRLP